MITRAAGSGDGSVRGQGWYSLAAWRFSTQWEGLSPVVRRDPGRSKAGHGAATYPAEFDRYFVHELKFRLNSAFENEQNSLSGLFQPQLQCQSWAEIGRPPLASFWVTAAPLQTRRRFLLN